VSECVCVCVCVCVCECEYSIWDDAVDSQPLRLSLFKLSSLWQLQKVHVQVRGKRAVARWSEKDIHGSGGWGGGGRGGG
jgi:hypothetical protein